MTSRNEVILENDISLMEEQIRDYRMQGQDIWCYKSYDDDKGGEGVEDGPDPFLAYKSFQQFKDSQKPFSSNDYTPDRSYAKKSDDSLKKLSSSLSSSKITSDYSGNSSKLSSSSFNSSSFDYKSLSSSAKVSSDSANMFSSTPKYSDYGGSTLNRSVSKH